MSVVISESKIDVERGVCNFMTRLETAKGVYIYPDELKLVDIVASKDKAAAQKAIDDAKADKLALVDEADQEEIKAKLEAVAAKDSAAKADLLGKLDTAEMQKKMQDIFDGKVNRKV